MQFLFALTLLVSATLLFAVQPMFAKMVLPSLGGAPNVWNTCMVFYQAVLLGGYAYAHFSTRRLGPRRQAILHLPLLCFAWLVLPIAISAAWIPPAEGYPFFWLIGLMAVCVGLPFFLVSATAPMLQAWFAETDHPSAKDPYYLYAASNVGSLVALLAYPTLIEPSLRLKVQSWAWAWGFGVLMFLIACCAVVLWRRPAAGAEPAGAGTAGSQRVEPPGPAPTAARRLRWVLLALAPSSLMLGVTTYVSTDLATVPLLWVIPLSLYLLTFVLVFARRPLLRHSWMVRVEPFFVLPLAAWFYFDHSSLAWSMIPLLLATFFVIAMVCHGELAATRPPARHLTEFYLWMSLGGVLGGLFNALIAPYIFTSIFEFPLMIVAACALRPQGSWGFLDRWVRRVVLAAAGSGAQRLASLPRKAWERALDLPAPALVAVIGVPAMMLANRLFPTDSDADEAALWWCGATVLILAVLATLCFSNRPVRFALGVAAVMLIGYRVSPSSAQVLCVYRNFFGVVRVTHGDERNRNILWHGTIPHGRRTATRTR